MSQSGEAFIAQVRQEISQKRFAEAQALLDNPPASRTEWTSQENDEVICLVEFLSALKDAAFT